jgi:hypothetical protein
LVGAVAETGFEVYAGLYHRAAGFLVREVRVYASFVRKKLKILFFLLLENPRLVGL